MPLKALWLAKSEQRMTAAIQRAPTFVSTFQIWNRASPAQLPPRKPRGQEDIAMFVRRFRLSSAGRSIALATVAAVTLTAAEPSMAFPGSAPAGKGASMATDRGLTEVSARRRTVRPRRVGSASAAAAAAAFAGIVGTGLAIAAARSSYDDYGYYGGPGYYVGPGYYGGAPYYYGGYGGYRGGVPYYRGHPLAGW
jgi:hypothetical protein